jgi:Tfp pilus assembly protein PilV
LQSGSTLLEVLIAFAILSMALLALMQIQMTLHHLHSLSRQVASATHWAEAELEHLAALRWTDLPADGSHAPALKTHDDPSTPLSLTRTLHTPSPGWRTLQIQVQWDDAEGARHTLRWHSARAQEPTHWPQMPD